MGDLGAFIRGQITKANLVVMDKIWDNGFREVTSSTRPITGPDDLKGFKIRVPVSPLWTSMFKAFDSAPASINISEVYSALQTKVVEGQENPLAIIIDRQILRSAEILLADQPHVGRLLVPRQPPRLGEASGRSAQRRAKNINAAGMKEREDVAKLNANLRKDLEAKGMVFNDLQIPPFRDKLKQAGFYSEWKAKYGDEAWALLETSAGKLG